MLFNPPPHLSMESFIRFSSCKEYYLTSNIFLSYRYPALLNCTTVYQNLCLHFRIVETRFEKTPPIPTYLIALLVSKYQATSDNSTIPNINIYARPSQKKHSGTAIKYTRDIVEALGRWTNIKYEDLGISKLDVVAFPYLPSEAMENWGLITFQ